MEKLDILSISSRDYRRGKLTGGHRRYAEMIRCLSDGNNIYLIAPSLTPNAVDGGVVLLRISESRFASNLIPNSLIHLLKVCSTAWRHLRKKPFDAVVVLAISNGLSGLLIKWLWRSKLVTFLLEDPQEYRTLTVTGKGLRLSKSGTIHNKLFQSSYLALFRQHERIVLLGSDRIIVESEKYRRILSERYPRKRDAFRVLPANINTSWIIEEAEGLENKSSQARRLCFVGWLHPRKGLTYLLDAFEMLLMENADITLEVAGTGPLSQDLEEKSARNPEMKARLTFHGWMSNPMPLIAQCDLLIVPSLSDSFPEVIGEALYVGTPVIGSRVGGIPEQLEYDELLFEPANAQALAKKLQPIIENEDQYQLVRKCCALRRDALTFDWGAKLNTLLNAVLEPGESSGD